MTIIIFIVVLAVLVFVHELGHFCVAKLSGVRVDEFGIGFPPKVFSFKPQGSETTYSINLIPFGGFVKIFGENPDDESINGPDSERSFVHKSPLIQIAILVAGVLCNVLLAWVLISSMYLLGVKAPVSQFDGAMVSDSHMTITHVLPDSPASEGGLTSGDELVFLRGPIESLDARIATVDDIQTFIGNHQDTEIQFVYDHEGTELTTGITPVGGIIPDRGAIGIAFDRLGIIQLPWYKALTTGAHETFLQTKAVAFGLGHFVGGLISGSADMSQITGPVGIVGMVGDASRIGFSVLLGFVAIISLNLAIINLLPFPALDGGRVLFVIIEVFKGSPISPKVANAFNTVGFILLLLLMVVVTVSDVLKII